MSHPAGGSKKELEKFHGPQQNKNVCAEFPQLPSFGTHGTDSSGQATLLALNQ